MQDVGSPSLWVGFVVFVLLMLALDLGVFHRRPHDVSVKEATIWSLVWIALAMLFNVGVYHWFGAAKGTEFLTGYLIEKALSVDNIFIFVIIFSYFSVPKLLQHRVLFWGVLGALMMRAAFIVLGSAFLNRFHWAIYVFGGLLVVTGIKLLIQRDDKPNLEDMLIIRAIRRVIPMTPQMRGSAFFVRENGVWMATPLFLALMAVEGTDLIFALDSIPAIFAITRDPFIVFTSNIFAILGLRSLYFVLAGVIDKFIYLKVGLAFVLIFVGLKMALVNWVKVPIGVSLGTIGAILAFSVFLSLWVTSQRNNNALSGVPKGQT